MDNDYAKDILVGEEHQQGRSSWAPDFGGPVYLGLDPIGNSIHALPSQIEKTGGVESYYNRVYNYRLGMIAFNMIPKPIVQEEGYAGYLPVINGKFDMANAILERWNLPVDPNKMIASGIASCCPGDPRSGIIWNSTQIDELFEKLKDGLNKKIEDFKRWYERPVDGEEILERLFDEKYDHYMKKYRTPVIPQLFKDPRYFLPKKKIEPPYVFIPLQGFR
jgi:hypothetical protein